MVTLPSISRALKTARGAVFAPRDADAGLRLAVTASGCAPWAGLAFCDRCACSGFLFPPQAAVASAAGCSIPARVTFYARHLLKSVYKKSTTSNEVVLFGDLPVHLPRPKNSPRGCFCPAGRWTRGLGCSIPVLLYSLQCTIKRKKLNLLRS